MIQRFYRGQWDINKVRELAMALALSQEEDSGNTVSERSAEKPEEQPEKNSS